MGDLNPAAGVTRQRTPGGRSASNWYTHSRAPRQRPWPRTAAALSQSTRSGSGAPASPKRTASSLNLATTWLTRDTSPCGLSALMVRAWALVATARLPRAIKARRRAADGGHEAVMAAGQGGGARKA